MVKLDHSDPMRPVSSGGVPTIIGKIAAAKDTLGHEEIIAAAFDAGQLNFKATKLDCLRT